MTQSQLLLRLLDAAAQIACTVRLYNPKDPDAMHTFRQWCLERGHEMIVDDTESFRFCRVSLSTGAEIGVGEVKR